MMANNLAVVGGASALAVSGTVRIDGIAEVFRLADALSQAVGFVPTAYIGKPNAIAAAILTGIEIGMGPLESLRELHVVQGRVTLSSGAMLARAIRSGVRVEWLESTDKAARLRLTRGGVSYEQSWTLEDAKRAQLLGKSGPWQTYPGAMLRARAISAAVRAFCPDVIGGGGLYTPEEAQDIEPQGASSGSPEVRVLSEALHEAPEPEGVHDIGPELRAQLEAAMHSLKFCQTDNDIKEWVMSNSEALEREPISTRKQERWKAVLSRCRNVVPPVRTEPLKAMFAQARGLRSALAVRDAEAGITSDGEVTPGARAMSELQSVESRESALAWCDDNRDYLAGIEVGSSEMRVVWAAIEKRVGSEVALELEARMS